jgi:diguanylate cyclase (GGDEF)-like protein
MLFRQLLDAIDRMEAQTKIEHINKELQFVNSRLKQLAIKDPLTGLYNRQGFNEELELEMHKALEEKRMVKLALLYADLDNFKYYNDTFGHDIGDLILREFSTLITRICANRGYAVRYGGDEFILVLYLDDREQVEQAAKDIYANLQKQQGFVQKIAYTLKVPIEVPQEKYVSCSIGISMDTLEPAKALKEQLERTLKHADEMMYHVKKTTKHRYVFYEPTDK